ncbi:NlpC/P60 family protein [Streptomyces sp. NPDC001922]|uniref:C40 family peptidase n=1 Tax=Streptomyces sp. NPDC001922 TaxID=3364624 RepID=UPI00367F7B1B
MSGRFARSVRTAAVVAGTALAVSAPPPLAGAAPADPPVRELLTQLQTYYRKAEEAGEAYNATAERFRKQRAEVIRLNGRLAIARTELTKGQGNANRLVRDQYQGATAELSPYLRLLLSRRPQTFLDESHLLQRAADERAEALVRLARGERRLAGLAREARTALERQQTLARRRVEQRDTAQRRLDEVERMLASLSAEQLAELGRLEQEDTGTAQRALMGSGALDTERAPSRAGDRAVRYAVEQIGRPYAWGAVGPDSFDCSGLTQQAWTRAGRSIPRTSQEQWQRLRRVPLRDVRPGDLVVYFPEATHVALYVGEGMVVHAPRPGTDVKVSPLAANPLLGVVRPDDHEPSLARYVPPELPEGAADGDDTGYSGAPGQRAV